MYWIKMKNVICMHSKLILTETKFSTFQCWYFSWFDMLSNKKKKTEKLSTCPLFLYIRNIVLCTGTKFTAAQGSSFQPSERYLWWFTPGLPQEMLTTWNKIPPLPRAINKPKICESFSLQRWGEKLPWSIIIILSMDFQEDSKKFTRAPYN